MAYQGTLNTNSSIGSLIRKAENDFIAGVTHQSKYVDFHFSNEINKIYAYLESKHTTGETDSAGREKPFFNIVLGARNIWFRATDIDRKDIKLRSTKSSDDLKVFLATVHLQDWMRRERFGTFLNAWGINSAGFNESVLKFVDKGDRLVPSVIPWNRIICDCIDFDNNPKIEIIELTEGQLRQRKEYDQDVVERLCSAITTRKTTEKITKDTKSNYIRLYEVHGLLPESNLTDNDADETWVQQMHVVSFVAGTEGNYDDFTLFRGLEDQDPYMIGALLPEIDGSIALRGSVKTLFDAQWMQNHTAKAMKDQLDLASKLIFQTADQNFVGQNVLSSIENGDILIHATNAPLTPIVNEANIVALQNFSNQWKQIGNEIAGVSDAMLGQNPPSGTAWRQTQSLLNESHSLFELMTQNKGLVIEDMMRRFIIPFIKKKLNHSKEIASTLADYDIQQIDSKFISNYSTKKTNSVLKEITLQGQPIDSQMQSQMTQSFAQEAQQGLQSQGTTRYFAPSDVPDTTWHDVLKDIEWDPEVDVTGENIDTQAMDTLNTMFTTIAQNPNVLNNPNARMVFNKILELTGSVSPLEIQNLPPIGPRPTLKLAETMDYKDAPDDVKRQIEQQAGLQPSQIPTNPVAGPMNTLVETGTNQPITK